MPGLIPFTHKDNFANNQFISSLPNPAGLVRIAGQNQPIAIDGESMQTYTEDSDMALFNDIEDPNASADENVKSSHTATRGVINFMPFTNYFAHRYNKRFLEITEGGAYGKRYATGTYLTANSPQSAWSAMKNNPYQAGILDQYRVHANTAIGRALDYEAIFGMNPKFKNKSGLIGSNYLLADTTETPLANRIVKWDASHVGEPGHAEASNALRDAARSIMYDDVSPSYNIQGLATGFFNSALGDEQTTVGSAGRYANQVPLAGTSMNVENIPFALTPTLQNQAAATAAGFPSNLVIDAIVGDFVGNFRWGVQVLGDGIEVFDSGCPDMMLETVGGAQVPRMLDAHDECLLRLEASIGWGSIGGYGLFRIIAHEKPASGGSTPSPKSSK